MLNAADVRMKAKLLKHFVKIAQEAHKHTDLTTPYVIVSALKCMGLFVSFALSDLTCLPSGSKFRGEGVKGHEGVSRVV